VLTITDNDTRRTRFQLKSHDRFPRVMCASTSLQKVKHPLVDQSWLVTSQALVGNNQADFSHNQQDLVQPSPKPPGVNRQLDTPLLPLQSQLP